MTYESTAGHGRGKQKRPLTYDDIVGRKERRPSDYLRLPTLLLSAFRFVWKAAPRQLQWSIGLQIIGGVSIAAQLLVAKHLVDQFVQADVPPTVVEILPSVITFFLLLLGSWLVALARTEQQRLLTELVQRHAAQQVMDTATSVPLLFYDQPEFYDELQRAKMNAAARPVQMIGGLLSILQGGFAVVAIGSVLLWIEPLVFVLASVGYIPTWYLNRIGSRFLYRHQVRHTPGDRRREYLYQVTTRKNEAHETRAFGTSPFLRAEYAATYDRKIRDLRSVVKRRFLLGLVSSIISVVVSAAALIFLVTFVSSGRLDVASAAVALGALVLLAGRLRSFANGIGALYEASLFLEDFTEFMKKYAVEDRSWQSEKTPSQKNASSKIGSPFETISLEHVSFIYPSRIESSLLDISMQIRRGEIIALVGENGSGKTTLAKLLAGLYEPTTGRVRWDGTELAALDPSFVQDQIAVIFQDFARYFLTARENIAMGKPSRMNDWSQIELAAEESGAHQFLASLPEGYNTILGPEFFGGSDLSGGQWQRIALARAYLRDAPFLILDEPTAALDPRGEFEVYEHVRQLARGRTVVFISHRFSSARSADRIFVMREGRVCEEGTHEDLMAAQGLYEELFLLQSRSYNESFR